MPCTRILWIMTQTLALGILFVVCSIPHNAFVWGGRRLKEINSELHEMRVKDDAENENRS